MPVSVVDTNRVEMEIMRRSISKVLDLGSFTTNSLEISKYEDPGIYGMVYELRSSFLAHKFVEDRYAGSTTVEVPKTWWQHLKQDHAPAWFKTRYPVVKRIIQVELEVVFERYSTYPMADITMPENFGRSIIFERVKPYWKQYDK